MSKVISIRFSDLDLERLNKSASAEETTTTEMARRIVQEHYEAKNVNNKFEQVNQEIQLLKSKFTNIVDSNKKIIDGFNQLAAIVQSQKQGA